MEKGVAIEAGISKLLGFILEIEDVTKSKSFGHKNSALSFQAKVNLLTDLKFVPVQIARNFQLFAEIRNKFAHVQYVDTFSKCFEILVDQKNYFIKEFSYDKQVDVDEESGLNLRFTFLFFHLGLWLRVMSERSLLTKNDETNKTAIVEMLRLFFNYSPEKGSNEELFFLHKLKYW